MNSDRGTRSVAGPTETINNLIERVTRGAFGLRRFAHYRIRALLYVGKPNWTLLPASPSAEIRSAANCRAISFSRRIEDVAVRPRWRAADGVPRR